MDIEDIKQVLEDRMAKIMLMAKNAHMEVNDPIKHHHALGVLEAIEGSVNGEQKFLENLLEKLGQSMAKMVDIEGRQILEGEDYYEFDETILSEDTFDEMSHFISDEDDTFECESCGETFDSDYDGKYIFINGVHYCEECCYEFKRYYPVSYDE